MKTLVGINIDPAKPGFEAVIIAPVFVEGLQSCAGYRDVPVGRISVRWERTADSVRLEIDLPDGVDAEYGGQKLEPGKHIYII
ncbi:MAG: alpha-L-rhamnosidase C-terminal domain-containing protein [Eubacteriales bacterium]|nr:alpha-L-rhamnosidase C-terminal domain-containing protein [Eubacteriales bacterium]